MKLTRYALTLIAAAALVGCGSTVKLDDPAPVPVVDMTKTTPKDSGSTGATGPVGDSTVKTVNLYEQLTAEAKDKRVIYFDFDSDVVKEQYSGLVDLHARRLKANPRAALSLEGHTDERGGREYNLALGQRRAESVAKSMTLLGATAAQVEAVSFGKERPAAQGTGEEVWAKNRRVEIKDK